MLTFIPFYSPQLYSNMMESVNLYFSKLEFNASFYYGFKWFYWYVHKTGLILLKVVLLLSLGLIWWKNRLSKEKESFWIGAFWVFTAYLLSAQSVHPWYICIPLFLSVFTNYQFPKVWVMLSVLTYLTYDQGSMDQKILGYHFRSMLSL